MGHCFQPGAASDGPALAQGAAWRCANLAILVILLHTLVYGVQLLLSSSLLLWQYCRPRGLQASRRRQQQQQQPTQAAASSGSSSGSSGSITPATAALADVLLPSWAAAARTWVALAALFPRLVALALALALAPPSRQLLPLSTATYCYRHASSSHFYWGYLLLALLAPVSGLVPTLPAVCWLRWRFTQHSNRAGL